MYARSDENINYPFSFKITKPPTRSFLSKAKFAFRKIVSSTGENRNRISKIRSAFKQLIKSTTSAEGVIVIKIYGAFRRGNVSPKKLRHLTAEINKAKELIRENKNTILIFDLTNLTYWDTLGLRPVIDTVKSINYNSRNPRAGIVLNQSSFTYLLVQSTYLKDIDSGVVIRGNSVTELVDTLKEGTYANQRS